jgi:hypothetical protein
MRSWCRCRRRATLCCCCAWASRTSAPSFSIVGWATGSWRSARCTPHSRGGSGAWRSRASICLIRRLAKRKTCLGLPRGWSSSSCLSRRLPSFADGTLTCSIAPIICLWRFTSSSPSTHPRMPATPHAQRYREAPQPTLLYWHTQRASERERERSTDLLCGTALAPHRNRIYVYVTAGLYGLDRLLRALRDATTAKTASLVAVKGDDVTGAVLQLRVPKRRWLAWITPAEVRVAEGSMCLSAHVCMVCV